MAVTLATGTQIAIASAYGTGFTVTAISNANPAVATLSASHGVTVGDFIELNTGWDLLNGRLVRVSAVSTNDVTLESVNTLDTTKYPPGSSAGTASASREVTSWTNIGQVTGVSTGGGDQEYVDVTTITDRIRKQMPTVRAAQTIDITVLDDPTLAYYSVLQTASDTAALTGLRMVFSNNTRLLVNGTFSLQKMPDVNVNAPLTAKISFAAFADAVRYAT